MTTALIIVACVVMVPIALWLTHQAVYKMGVRDGVRLQKPRCVRCGGIECHSDLDGKLHWCPECRTDKFYDEPEQEKP